MRENAEVFPAPSSPEQVCLSNGQVSILHTTYEDAQLALTLPGRHSDKLHVFIMDKMLQPEAFLRVDLVDLSCSAVSNTVACAKQGPRKLFLVQASKNSRAAVPDKSAPPHHNRVMQEDQKECPTDPKATPAPLLTQSFNQPKKCCASHPR
eukprot:scaffold60288_cov16-Tisochrysis_lutea.AAC.1